MIICSSKEGQMRAAGMTLPPSRTLLPPGLIKTFIRPLYLDLMTNTRAALCTMFVVSYFVPPSGIGIMTGERQLKSSIT
jgi:hypothetical protein